MKQVLVLAKNAAFFDHHMREKARFSENVKKVRFNRWQIDDKEYTFIDDPTRILGFKDFEVEHSDRCYEHPKYREIEDFIRHRQMR